MKPIETERQAAVIKEQKVTRPEDEKIVSIELIYCEDGSRRIDITLINETIITVEGYRGGFIQSCGFGEEFDITQPVAERFVEWLNGGEL